MNKEEIGKELMRLRELQKLSRNAVARKLNTAYNRIKLIEEGQGGYSVDTLIGYLNLVKGLIIVSDIHMTPKEMSKEQEPAPIAIPNDEKKEKAAPTTMHKEEVKKTTSFKPVHVIGSKKKTVIEDADD